MRSIRNSDQVLGKNIVASGLQAVQIIEAAVGEGLSDSANSVRQNLFGRPLIGNDGHTSGASFAMGLATSGLRASGRMDSKNVSQELASLKEAVRRHVPYVIHADVSDPEFLNAISGTGCILLHSSCVQETVDLTIIAHKIAEQTLIPVVVAYDIDVFENVHLPEPKTLIGFLGDPDDFIECPNAAQKMVFGKTRRRIPNWFHFDYPTLNGASKDRDALALEKAAHKLYFNEPVSPVMAQAFAEFGKLTGRNYSGTGSYRTDDADYVLIAQGNEFHRAAAVVDHLRSKKFKAGCLNVIVLRPFADSEICGLLRGKKAVTLLEGLNAENDSLLYSGVLSALDKAVQNSSNKKSPVFPDLPHLTERERPTLYSGRFGELQFADLVSVFQNMAEGGKRRFFVGSQLTRNSSSYPKQQILLQNLNRDFPALESRMLKAGKISEISFDKTFSIRFAHSQKNSDSIEAAAVWLAFRLKTRVKARDDQFCLTREPWPYSIEKSNNINCLITDAVSVNQPGSLDDLKPEASILILSADEGNVIELGDSVRSRVSELKLHLHQVVGAVTDAEWLKGVLLTLTAPFFNETITETEPANLERYCKSEFGTILSEDKKVSFADGLTGIKKLETAALSVKQVVTKELPLALRRYEDHGPPYSKVSQFYDRAGIFYEQGRTDELVADPLQALPVMPAATANFADAGATRDLIPVLSPEKCTGCGQCSVYCPESAMPAIVLSAEALIKTAVEKAQAAGTTINQLTPPVIKNLSKLINQTFFSGTKNMYSIADGFPQALEKLASQMKIDGERLTAMSGELKIVENFVRELPVSAAEQFFSRAESQLKGSGLFYSVVVNPQACTGCGLCVNVCTDDALMLAPQNTEWSQKHQSAFRVWEQLPDTSGDIIQTLIKDDTYDPIAAIMLSRNYYMSMAGGVSKTRTSEKIMMHVIASVTESMRQSEVNQRLKEIDQYIQTLSDKIQNKLKDALPIANIDNLLNSLSGETARITADNIIAKLSETQRFGVLETAWVERVAGLIKDMKQLAYVLSKGPAGSGRSRFGVVLSSSDGFGWSKTQPYNVFTSPAIVFDEPSSAQFVLGLVKGHVRQMLDNIKLLRRAELESQNQYEAHIHDAKIARLEWNDLNESERTLVPPVLVFLDSAKISELNMPAVIELLTSGLPVKIFIFDTAKSSVNYWREQMALTTAVLSLKTCYFLQASLADPVHLFKGLTEGMRHAQPGFFRVLTPDAAADIAMHYPSLLKLALRSRAFPAIRFVMDSKKPLYSESLDISANPESYDDFSKSVSGSAGNYVVTFADWAFEQQEQQDSFVLLPDDDRHCIAMSEYLSMPEKERAGKRCYVLRIGEGDKPLKYEVPPEIIRASDAAHVSWRTLREIAGMLTPYPEKLKERLDEEWEAKQAAILKQLKSEYEEKLRAQESSQMESVKAKLRNKLMELSGYESKN